ncbi:MAG: Xaa-Pro dipeptidase [Acidobacteriota bacterium]
MASETPDYSTLYRQHLARLDADLTDAVERAGRAGVAVDGVIFHAGRAAVYHRDDEEIVFRTGFHYRRWVPPQGGPEHTVLGRPGRRPVVVRVVPNDFWHDTAPPEPSHWEAEVELHEVASFDRVRAVLESVHGGSLARCAYFGNAPAAAATLGVPESLIEPDALRWPLDWHRATKTDYEIALTRVACEHAARGHHRLAERFAAGDSERQLHWAYLEATDHLEFEIPYRTILALDEKSAILHYKHKRGAETGPGSVLLADAGAGHHGYAADITRTFVRDSTDATFRSLVTAMDALERRLVAMVTPGRSYVDIHLECHRGLADILVDHGIVRVGAEEAVDSRLTRVFMPHGVGHLMGLQVHDVGGHQRNPDGGVTEPPDDHVLRNTRTIEPGHLVTVEPGLYFIPMLLDPCRSGEHASAIDWTVVDRLIPLGGIRIEDDVVCTDESFDDLTRALVDG